MRNIHLSLLLVALSISCGTTPIDPPDDKFACPATFKKVREQCGCDPVLTKTYDALRAGGLRDDVTKVASNCLAADASLNGVSDKDIGLKLAGCVSKQITLDEDYKKIVMDLAVNAAKSASQSEKNSWDSCYDRVLTTKDKVQVSERVVTFDAINDKKLVTIQNLSRERIYWVVADLPNGYTFSPEDSGIPSDQSSKLWITRLPKGAKEKSTVAIQVQSSERHEIELVSSQRNGQINSEIKKIVAETKNVGQATKRTYDLVGKKASTGTTKAQKWVTAGKVLNENGNYTQGLTAFRNAKEEYPQIQNEAGYIYEMAKAQYKTGNSKNALQLLNKIKTLRTEGFQYLAVSNMLGILVQQKKEQCPREINCSGVEEATTLQAQDVIKSADIQKLRTKLPLYSEELDSTFGPNSSSKIDELITSVLSLQQK
jgi:hypothetical protein